MNREHGKACRENGNASLQRGNADTNETVVLDDPNLSELQAAPKSVKQTDDLFQIDASELGKPMKDSRPPLSDSTKHELNDAGTGQGAVTAPAGILLSFDSTSAPGSVNVSIARGNQCPIPLPFGSEVPSPYRIPSSVFARTKSTTPMEWSVTSNESLFSIHMSKSGDLSSQFDGYPPVSPDVNASSLKDALKATESEKHVEEDRPTTVDRASSSYSESQLSDGGSAKSYRSFAFPILAGESAKGSFNCRSAGRPLEKAQLQPPVPQTPPESAEPPSAESTAPKKSRLPCFSCCSIFR